MRHYHVTVRKGTTNAVHSVTTLGAVIRLWRVWAGWADDITRTTCYRQRCHPLAD